MRAAALFPGEGKKVFMNEPRLLGKQTVAAVYFLK